MSSHELSRATTVILEMIRRLFTLNSGIDSGDDFGEVVRQRASFQSINGFVELSQLGNRKDQPITKFPIQHAMESCPA